MTGFEVKPMSFTLKYHRRPTGGVWIRLHRLRRASVLRVGAVLQLPPRAVGVLLRQGEVAPHLDLTPARDVHRAEDSRPPVEGDVPLPGARPAAREAKPKTPHL